MNNETAGLAEDVEALQGPIPGDFANICVASEQNVITAMETLKHWSELQTGVPFTGPLSPAMQLLADHGARPMVPCHYSGTELGWEWHGFGLYGNAIAARTEFLFPSDNQFSGFPFMTEISWICLSNTGLVGGAGEDALQSSRLWLNGPDPNTSTGCIVPARCMCIPESITPPVSEPIPEPVPPSPVPITPLPIEECPSPVECPIPDGRVIVALDCDTRLLIVINAAELCNFPNAIEIAECTHGSEFDLDELCAICETPEEEPPEDILPPLPGIVEPILKALAIECNLPAVNTIRPGRRTGGAPRIGGVSSGIDMLGIISAFVSGPGLLSLIGRIPGLNTTPGLKVGTEIVRLVIDFIRNAYADLIEFQTKLTRSALGVKGCLNERSVDLTASRAIVSIINGLTFGSMKEELVAYDQAVAEECPTSVPSAEQALSAWLSNRVNTSQLKCWVEANNFRWDEWKFVADSAQKKPGILELLGMWRREIINEDGLHQKARDDGWINRTDVERFQRLTEFVPGPSDLVRFMVRDTADEETIDWTQSDESFVEKFTGPMLRWAKAQAIPDEVMKFHWRAHWRLPSPTQLFTMLHRLGRRPDGTEIVAFKKRVRQALQQDDVHPNWVDDIMAINFTLPRLTQIRRLLRSGQFSEADILAEFVKRGLETKTAEAMTKFEIQEAKKSFRSNPLISQFAKGNLNERELRRELADQGASLAAVDDAVGFGQLKMQMDSREECLKAIRHKVLIGEIDEAEAGDQAFLITRDRPQATALAETWKCERDSRSKISTASELCAFFKDGLIGVGDFTRGLLRIGMPLERANRLVARCRRQLTKAQQLEDDRERKKAQAEAKRLAREAEKASKLSESQLRQRESALEKANTARDRQEKRLAQASKTIANRNELDYETLLPQIIAIARSAVASGFGKMEEVSNIAQIIATSRSVSGPVSFQEVLMSTLQEVGP